MTHPFHASLPRAQFVPGYSFPAAERRVYEAEKRVNIRSQQTSSTANAPAILYRVAYFARNINLGTLDIFSPGRNDPRTPSRNENYLTSSIVLRLFLGLCYLFRGVVILFLQTFNFVSGKCEKFGYHKTQVYFILYNTTEMGLKNNIIEDN